MSFSLYFFFSNNLKVKLTLDSYFFQGITFKQVWVHYVLIACVLNMNSWYRNDVIAQQKRLKQPFSKVKKNVYALKTPRVVSPTFILWCRCLCLPQWKASPRPLVSSLIHQAPSGKRHQWNIFWPCELDLWTWPRYPRSTRSGHCFTTLLPLDHTPAHGSS